MSHAESGLSPLTSYLAYTGNDAIEIERRSSRSSSSLWATTLRDRTLPLATISFGPFR